MSSSSEALFDHIADLLKFISSAQSLWFTLNTSYDHGCHLASRFGLDPEEYEALLIIAGLASYTRFGFQIKATASLLSHCLSSSSCCTAHLSSRCASCFLHCLSTRRPLVVLSSCRAASHCLVAPAGCRIIISRCPLIALPSRPLIVIGTTTARESRASGSTTMATGGATMRGTTTARGSDIGHSI
jgi:hypothetical protein